MNDTQQAIDWIFNAIRLIFQLMVSNWILSFIILIGLISIVISIYLSARSR